MARIGDRFQGHVRPGDPRTLVTAAGGCTWPTVPPFRWALTSDNATGIYAPFNGANVMFELVWGETRHELGVWRLADTPWWLYAGVIKKYYIRDLYPQFTYSVKILMTLWSRDEFAFANRTGRCNTNVHLGDQIGGLVRGRVGSTFRLLQVEFDKTEPP